MENTHNSAADPTSAATAAGNAGGALGGAASTGNSASAGAGGKTSSAGGVPSSLKSLNRASYKISKPLPRNNPNPSPAAERSAAAASHPPPPPPAGAGVSGGGGGGGGGSGGGPPYQPQPPVYNIDKNDFRDVVQKLTGSPAHAQSRPPPAEAPPPPQRPPSIALPAAAVAPTSRLHRIRPPPLAHLAQRPPPLVPAPPLPAVDPWTRPPLSPLPPLPVVSAAAESPISAYMRNLRRGGGGVALPGVAPSPMAAPVLPPPSSPLGFGCLLSPRTAYQVMMAAPGMQLPTSPGVPLASPRLGDP